MEKGVSLRKEITNMRGDDMGIRVRFKGETEAER